MVKRYFLTITIILMIEGIISHSTSWAARDRMKGPEKHNCKTADEEEYGKGNNTLLNLYQRWISPVKGGNKCPMHPSCSQYAKIAFQKLPWYRAYLMSCERILRCGNELYLYPTIQAHGIMRWYDPLSKMELRNDR